jgi:hypothetical protein
MRWLCTNAPTCVVQISDQQQAEGYLSLVNVNVQRCSGRVVPRGGLVRIRAWKRRLRGQLIDYRCEDGRFLVSSGFITIPNSDLLPSSETRANPENQNWKKHPSEWAQCQEAIADKYFTKKQRTENLTTSCCFIIWYFQTPALKRYLQVHLLWWTVWFFDGDDRGSLKQGAKTHLMTPISLLNSSTLFLFLHL